jgi:glycosyltransferase involved in cell wall biosynthesis
MKLSAIIITKDASKRLEDALKSVKGIVDEITVVDTGSTDKTIVLAKKYTRHVFEVPLNQDFSIVRNYALSRSVGEWILVLDADEVLSDELKRQIPELIKHRTYDGFWFRRRWYVNSKRYLKHGLFYPDWQLRLFRNSSDIQYIHRVHEEVTIPAEKTKQIQADIFHYDSIRKYLSWKGFRELDSYIRMQAMMHKEERCSTLTVVGKAIHTFLDMFVVGLTRGKGILDGWVGVKAHFFFALSVTKGYLEAL